MLALDYGAATHVGAVRELNEDAALAEPLLFAVADGMGGHAAGEVASALAVERLRQLAGRDSLESDDVVEALAGANADILACARHDTARRGMGTTMTGLSVVVVGGSEHWLAFNIGDSRVYRLADGRMERLTVDHSEVEELLAAGRITVAEVATHPLRNVITRSLGTDPGPEPDVWIFPPAEGERFLLCSDGLPLEVDEPTMARMLDEAPDAQTAADRLVQAAVAAGGRDNVTAVVVRVLPRGGAASGDMDGSTAPRSDLARHLAGDEGA